MPDAPDIGSPDDEEGMEVPRVPDNAVFISPEMMNDPKVQKALAAMKSQQMPEAQEAPGTKQAPTARRMPATTREVRYLPSAAEEA